MDKNEKYYNDEYMPKMNRIGKITGYVGVLICFLPAVVLAVVYGILPPKGALVTAVLTAWSAFAVMWFVEPISYFTVLGPVGTYMAFLSGNISNMRVPCASVAQLSADVKPGSKEGSIIATIGMAVSVVINISVLTIGVILGSSILSKLPASVTEALNYLLPALFGALLVQFGRKQLKHTGIVLVFALLVCAGLKAGIFNWLPSASNYLHIISSIVLSIAIGIATVKKKERAK